MVHWAGLPRHFSEVRQYLSRSFFLPNGITNTESSEVLVRKALFLSHFFNLSRAFQFKTSKTEVLQTPSATELNLAQGLQLWEFLKMKFWIFSDFLKKNLDFSWKFLNATNLGKPYIDRHKILILNWQWHFEKKIEKIEKKVEFFF